MPSTAIEVQDRDSYIRYQAQVIQNSIVNTKTSDSPTISNVVWTYRNTNCDVVSVITTVVPLFDGRMKDLKLPTKEPMKLKPPMKKSGKNLPHGSPFEDGLTIDLETSRRRVSNLLKGERRSFLDKLKTTKFLRSALENRAAVIIQRHYRGHFVRRHIHDIVRDKLLQKQIRADLKRYLMSRGISISLRGHRNGLTQLRQRAAIVIQSIFRRFVSRRGLIRRQRERWKDRRRMAAIMIQCMFRCVTAKHRVNFRRNKVRFIKRTIAALKIQCGVRKLFARRRVRRRRFKLRWLAARMIQCWFRARNSRKISRAIKDILHRKRLYRGALRMQCLVRRFLSCRRVNRIRLRSVFSKVFKGVSKIQAMIRKFLANIRVRKVRIERQAMRESNLRELEEKRIHAEQASKAAEMKAFVESVDVYKQAAMGQVAQVEAIIAEQMSGSDVNDQIHTETGDSLLSVAAAIGNLDLTRKCLKWGFDPNHRNFEGLSPLLLAARGHHTHVVQYLLAPPSSESTSSEVEDSKSIGIALEPLNEDDVYQMLAFAIDHPKPSAYAHLASSSAESVSSKENSTNTHNHSNNSNSNHNQQQHNHHSHPPHQHHHSNKGNRPLVLLTMLIHFGLNLNSKQRDTGMTALLCACELGNADAVRHLLKNRIETDISDENGQTPLHKACMSSPEIVKGLLGLDTSLGIIIPEETRASYLLKSDAQGKNCALLAALHGQRGVLEIIHDVLIKTPLTHLPLAYQGLPPGTVLYSSEEEDIGWGPRDIEAALARAEANDAYCLERILQAGFDGSTWSQESTGVTLAMCAARSGSMEVLDLLMSREVDMSPTDSKGRNVMHYAAINRTSPVLAHLLSHAKAKACQVSEMMLAGQDWDQADTPLHIMAREGIEASIDLLAKNGLEAAMTKRNCEGMTPLHVACSHLRHSLIHLFLLMNADAKAVDLKGRSALWHAFHPFGTSNGGFSSSSTSTSSSGGSSSSAKKPRVPVCSEMPTRRGSTLSRRERDEDTQRLARDTEVVMSLLRHGCPLYQPSSLLVTLDKLLAMPMTQRPTSASHVLSARNAALSNATSANNTNTNTNTNAAGSSGSLYNPQVDELLDCGDMAARELSLGIIKLLPSVISPKECWRLALSCIRFDDGSSKSFLALLEGGGVDLLAQGDVQSPKKSTSNANSSNNLSQQQSADSARPTTPQSDLHSRPSSATVVLSEHDIHRLQNAFFGGFTIAGWIIRLGNTSALQQLVRRGYGVHVPVDMQGNSCLHLIAAQTQLTNASAMIDIISNDSRMRIEQSNFMGFTPAMLCAKHSNMAVFKKLAKRGVNARKGLEGRYVSWMLAFARRRERQEKNTQTGRTGSDDELYFHVDPSYLVWM